jgi:hypothetical protein
MNAPFPFANPYLTDPHEYAARHRDQSEQALTTQPCTHYHGAHATYTRLVHRAVLAEEVAR